MEKPLALKVISIIIIIFSVIRLSAGLLGGVAYALIPEDFEINLLIIIIIENFICGGLLLTAGIKLLKGKKIGRILLILSTILAPLSYLVLLHEFNYSYIISIVLIILLYFYPSIKSYFENIEV